MLTSMQGTDIYGGNTGTFSKEAGGMIKAYNNAIEGASRIVYANEDAIQFDAYLATSREEKVADTFKTVSGSNVYNNFDTDPSIMYNYTAQEPENVVGEVTKYSGRMNGGDLSFAFNNEVDDSSYAVNAALMAALKNYKSDLVSVGGVGQVSPSEPVVTPTVAPTATPTVKPTLAPSSTPSQTSTPEATSGPVVSGTITHDFTSQGVESSVFTFPNKANLSTSYGSVNYNGMTLTKCLKMETGTEIVFTAVADGQFTMVFSTEKGKVNAKVNGEKVTGDSTTGILTIPVVAGTKYSVEKADSAYVFYMTLTGNKV